MEEEELYGMHHCWFGTASQRLHTYSWRNFSTSFSVKLSPKLSVTLKWLPTRSPFLYTSNAGIAFCSCNETKARRQAHVHKWQTHPLQPNTSVCNTHPRPYKHSHTFSAKSNTKPKKNEIIVKVFSCTLRKEEVN